MMKLQYKKIISFFLAVFILVSLFPYVAFNAPAAGVSFFVARNTEAGLDGNVSVTLTGSSSTYSGKIFLPGGADPSGLFLSWSGASSVSVGGKAYQSGKAPIPAKDQSLTYSVTSGSTTTKYTLTTMQGSAGVRGLFLNINESYDDGTHTIQAMNADRDHNAFCYGSFAIDGEDHDMTIKGRGNWTWFSADKKPYNITVFKSENPEKEILPYDKKDSVKLISGVKSKKWSLLANYADGSLMRNKIGYDLACKLGIGLESNYVDLWMNGEYKGNYLLTPKTDYNAPDGGYMLELDNNLDQEDPYFSLDGLDSTSDSANVFTVKDIGDDAVAAGENTSTIQKWMQTMFTAVKDTTNEKYLDYIDIDSWAKLYLIQELFKNYDIICGSMFMRRNGLTENDKLIAGPVWDLDNTMGRVFYNSNTGMTNEAQVSADGWIIDGISKQKAFLQYLGKHESFMQRVYEIYNEYKADFNGILTEIDELSASIKDSAKMNFTVWDVDQSQYNANRITQATTHGSGTYAYKQVVTSSWENCIANLRAFASARLLFFSNTLSVTAPAVGTIGGNTETALFDTLSLSYSVQAAQYQWQISDDGVSWQNISGATSKTYSATALMTLDGKMVRCVARNLGTGKISTTRVFATKPAARSASEPVTLTVDLNGHRHDYKTVVTAVTCTTDGYTTSTCACGDVLVTDRIPATGHDYVNGKCTHCGGEDPLYEPCVVKQNASLAAGKLYFTVGGTEMGEYTFASYNSGWSIRNANGRYLSVSNGKLSTTGTSAYAWTYSNNRFSARVSSSGRTTTYYLVSSGGTLSIATSTTNATVSFAKMVEKELHTFGAWQADEKGNHVHKCSVCGFSETRKCSFDATHYCTVCGHIDPNIVFVTATFVTGEGASQAPGAQTVIQNEGLIRKPDDPTYIGFVFLGWYADDAPFNFAKPLQKDVTLTAKWAECTDHFYRDFYCIKCGAHDPADVPVCFGRENASLASGELILTLKGQEMGTFTFASYGSGWSICNANGKYLSLSGSTLAEAAQPFAWTFSNNRFSAKSGTTYSRTYYLVNTNNAVAVATSTTNATAAFIRVTESKTHTFGPWKTEGEKHTRVCSVCGAKETGACHYDYDHFCSDCRTLDPAYAGLEVSVAITQSNALASLLLRYLGESASQTYTASITTLAVGVTVKTVEYSVDEGTTWVTGTTFTSPSEIKSFLIRVTDQRDNVYLHRFTGEYVTRI